MAEGQLKDTQDTKPSV